jgi:hypothetical protein
VFESFQYKPFISLNSSFLQNQKPFLVFFCHTIFRFSEQRVFFSTLSNQTFDTYSFNSVISYFSIHHIICISYISGLFLGGIFFDLCGRARIFKIIEYLFIILRVPPSDWKKEVDKWTKRFIIAFVIRTIPFYTIDNLVFSSFGFFGRDTEIRRQVSRNAFRYSIDRGKVWSVLFEGRHILGEDSYGRSAPDIIRKPWHISRLAVEATRDLVDETYRTQVSSQRVDIIYLGTLERNIFEWLEIHNQDNSVNDSNKQKPVKEKVDDENINYGIQITYD